MKYHVFNLLFLLLLLNPASCVSRRNKYLEDSEKTQAIHRTEKRAIDSQAHRLTIASHLDSLGYHETATIIPLGRFTYHPDSGYRGYAARVQLRRRGIRTERYFRHDSVQHLYRTAMEVSDSIATKEAHAVEQREKRHIPWRWVAAVLVLVSVVGFLARRLFR